jgi:hypothetical protein
MRTYRESGWEDVEIQKQRYKPENLHKLDESISRTRSKVFEICLCNEFDYFFTLTVNAEKHDRYDLEEYHGKLSKWLNNYNSRKGADIKYILVPEQHKDGAWHMHGLLKGLPESHLTPFSMNDDIPEKLKQRICDGHEPQNWTAYSNAFGWVSLERIRDKGKSAGYVSKYITKQATHSQIKKHDHMYYCSKGLKRAERVFVGLLRQGFTPDYKNDFAAVKVCHSLEEAMTPFCGDSEPLIEWNNTFDPLIYPLHDGTHETE